MDNIKKMGVKLTYRAILAFVGMFSFTPMMCGWVYPKTVLTLRENIQKRNLRHIFYMTIINAHWLIQGQTTGTRKIAPNANSLQEVIF